jgi:hypothetical protein
MQIIVEFRQMDSNRVLAIHHVSFVVSNAMQAAFWYSCSMGFERFVKKRTKTTITYGLRNGNVSILLFFYPYTNTSL